MTSNNFLRAAFLLLIIPCLYVGWLALRWGIADSYAYDARQLEKAWKADDNFSRNVLLEAISGTESAVRWAPDNPEYLDQLSRYLTLRYMTDKDQETAETIKAHLLHSRAIRPTWPGNWAAFIDIKYYAGEADDELNNALIQGAQSGPWDPSTIQAITQAGVAYWKVLDPEARNAVNHTVKRGLASPVSGLSMRTASLTEQGVGGWTIEFTQALKQTLVDEDWQQRNAGAYIRLTLTLWPLLSSEQKNALLVKMIDPIVSSGGNKLLKQVRDSGKLPFICPRLPRTPQFNRICAASLTP